MSAQRHKLSMAILAIVIAAGLFLPSTAMTQAAIDEESANASRRLSNQSVGARRIAWERYQFLHRFETKYNVELSTHYFSISVLFLFGKSDRAYMLVMNAYTPHARLNKYQIRCYHRKNGKDKLLYVIYLREVDESQNHLKDMPVQSMRDYLNRMGWDAKGEISKFAMKDITTKREYVEYEYQIIVGMLQVDSTYDINRAEMESYDYDPKLGPITQDIQEQHPKKFYRKYGLPMLSKELQPAKH